MMVLKYLYTYHAPSNHQLCGGGHESWPAIIDFHCHPELKSEEYINVFHIYVKKIGKISIVLLYNSLEEMNLGLQEMFLSSSILQTKWATKQDSAQQQIYPKQKLV